MSLSIILINNSLRKYDYVYDQIVGFGELLSTKILSAYLLKIGINNEWIDVRTCIKTDENHRDASVNWQETQESIRQKINLSSLNITQGFLGGTNSKTTTLGREGSDYTAGIFAYCLNAKSVTIWKDVPGVLNADPRVFSETKLLNNISYTEAIEMAFYGASVIHPKTLQPLEQKNIPLYVRSFEDLSNKGTCVGVGDGIEPKIPCFMVESNISHVFEKLDKYKLKVNLIQNSAISFSVCIEDKFHLFDNFYNDLKTKFVIKTYKEVTLYTIRHFNKDSIDEISKKGKPIIRQINTKTAQLVI